MRRLLIAGVFASAGAMAQVSAPLVSEPAFTGVSDSIQNMSLQAQSLAFTAGDFRPSRNHYRTKDLAAIEALSRAIQIAAPSVSTTAGTPYMQTATYQAMGAPVGTNFEALGLGTPGFNIMGAPPDTTLAVGPSHILQWVNSQMAVYDKAGNPLLAAPGFVNGNVIWQGMPPNSLCRQFNRGDPIVQYDRIAQRWILSQFAFTTNFGSNAQCFAVSQTNNPMGAYNLYEYNFGNTLPDYGKMGVWPDALYMSYNMFGNNANSFSDARACAYDKTKMYAGMAALQICFADPNSFSYLPSDLDGSTLPPGGTPNIFVSWNWYNVLPPYTMQLTKFVPNFINPALSTFNDGFGGATFSAVNVALPNTLAPCNDAGSGNGFQCVPQVGTAQTLDTLGDRHMYRLVYRNFGTHDSLLVTQSVDADGAGPRAAALRWIEVRKPAANPPVVYQNSTFNTSADSRWMSSGAFDKLGNIAIGYSSSSSTLNPSIRIAGRLKNDPKNLLRTELMIKAGTGSQTSSLERWGDYTTMQIDPSDDCTFWYTAQYIATNGTFNWRTRVAAFKFPNCN